MRFEEIKMDEAIEVNGGGIGLAFFVCFTTYVAYDTYKKCKKYFNK